MSSFFMASKALDLRRVPCPIKYLLYYFRWNMVVYGRFTLRPQRVYSRLGCFVDVNALANETKSFLIVSWSALCPHICLCLLGRMLESKQTSIELCETTKTRISNDQNLSKLHYACQTSQRTAQRLAGSALSLNR